MMTSNWRNAMAATSLNIAAITVEKIIESSTAKSVQIEKLNYTTKNYLHNPMRPILVNVLSASCRYHLIGVNLCFGHAAAKSFVTAACMPMLRDIWQNIDWIFFPAHSVESLMCQITKRVKNE